MPEPITVAILHWLFGHGTAAGATHAAATHAAVGHAAAAHAAAAHTTILTATVAAGTIGGITFLNLYNHLLDDAYKYARRNKGRSLYAYEQRQVLDAAYRSARRELAARRLLSGRNSEAIEVLYAQKRHAIAG